MKATQVAKEAGSRWSALSDADKKPFQEQVTKAKQEWPAKKDAYGVPGERGGQVAA